MLQHHDNKYLNSPVMQKCSVLVARYLFLFSFLSVFFFVCVCVTKRLIILFVGVAGNDDEFWQSASGPAFGKCFRGCSGVYCASSQCNGVGGAKAPR